MESIEKLKKRVWVAGSSTHAVGWVSVVFGLLIYFWSISDEAFYESGLGAPTFFGTVVIVLAGAAFIYLGGRIKNNPDAVSLNDFGKLLWVFWIFFLWLILTGSRIGIMALLLAYYLISGYRAIVKLSSKNKKEDIPLIVSEKKVGASHPIYPMDILHYFLKEKNRRIKANQEEVAIEKPITEKNKTISYLESKVWYRALKVVYLISFVLTAICGNIIIFDSIPDDKDKLTSTNKPVGVTLNKYVLNDEKRKQLDGIVADMARKNATQEDVEMIVNDFKQKYGLLPKKFDFDVLEQQAADEKYFERFSAKASQSQSQSSDAFWQFLMDFIAGNLSILLFFEVVRRLFYYVVLGSLRPQKI